MGPTYVVENIGICCGYTLPTTYRHPQHMQWAGVVHNIYPQHIDGIHNIYVLHNSVVHHIHPQHQICCPQPNTRMDTPTTYHLSSTTYMYSTTMLSTIVELHVVDNMRYMVDNTRICCGQRPGHMLWATWTYVVGDKHVVHNICHMLSTTYVLQSTTCNPQHHRRCCGLQYICCGQHVTYVVDELSICCGLTWYMLWTYLVYVVDHVMYVVDHVIYVVDTCCGRTSYILWTT